MPNPSSFEQAVEKRMTQPAAPQTRYGYPIEQPHVKKMYDAYFKSRPEVAGMVVGGGHNGTDPNEPVSIISNPYNKHMSDEGKREGLYKIEATLAVMADNPISDYPISENLQRLRKQYFKAGRDPYATDDAAFRKSLISRVLSSDIPEKLITPEMRAEADRYEKLLQQRQ